MRKILTVIGARPQFIKHSPVVLQLKKYFNTITVHTGQHYDANMSAVFFDQLQIPLPDYMLDIHSGNHGEQTGKMMIALENIVIKENPDAVLVYGDTNSTLAGALVAAKLNIPVIHIEAGLRSFNKHMPEEINRIMTDHVSEILFCPSGIAEDNLRKEGISKHVFVCGDVMRDMMDISQNFLANPLVDQNYVFATIHRPYNTDDKQRMKAILEAFNTLDQKVLFPIHPRTMNKLKEYGLDPLSYSNILFTGPVGYIESLSAQKYAHAIVTDSGGIQKEAYWLKKKCVTIRTETEWTETLEHGWNTLVYEDFEKIKSIMNKPNPSQHHPDVYGSSHSAEKIALVLREHLN